MPCSIPWATPDTSHGDAVPQDPKQAGRGAEPPQSKPSQALPARCCLSSPAWGHTEMVPLTWLASAPHPASPTHPSLPCTHPACPHPSPTHPSPTIPPLPVPATPPHTPLPYPLPQPHISQPCLLIPQPHTPLCCHLLGLLQHPRCPHPISSALPVPPGPTHPSPAESCLPQPCTPLHARYPSAVQPHLHRCLTDPCLLITQPHMSLPACYPAPYTVACPGHCGLPSTSLPAVDAQGPYTPVCTLPSLTSPRLPVIRPTPPCLPGTWPHTSLCLPVTHPTAPRLPGTQPHTPLPVTYPRASLCLPDTQTRTPACPLSAPHPPACPLPGPIHPSVCPVSAPHPAACPVPSPAPCRRAGPPRGMGPAPRSGPGLTMRPLWTSSSLALPCMPGTARPSALRARPAAPQHPRPAARRGSPGPARRSPALPLSAATGSVAKGTETAAGGAEPPSRPAPPPPPAPAPPRRAPAPAAGQEAPRPHPHPGPHP